MTAALLRQTTADTGLNARNLASRTHGYASAGGLMRHMPEHDFQLPPHVMMPHDKDTHP